jgi:hypothetical protein
MTVAYPGNKLLEPRMAIEMICSIHDGILDSSLFPALNRLFPA